MVFESVRGYVELASGLGDLTRARALEAAQGLLSLPAVGIATGSKVAVQASTLADELLAAAAANRSNLTALVRSEVDIAITALGLVPAQRLADAQAEAQRLRSEVARLRSASSTESSSAAAGGSTVKKAAKPRSAVKKAVAPGSTVKKAAKARSTVKRAAAPGSTVKKTATSKRASRKAAAPKAAAPTAAAPKAAAADAAAPNAAETASTTAGRSAVTTRARPAGS